MRTFNVNFRLSDDLRDICELLKLREGGLTGFLESALRKEADRTTAADWELLKAVRRMKVRNE